MDRTDWQDEERREAARKAMEHTLRKPSCPECGSERILETNTVYAHYPITRLDEHGEPDDYDVAEVLWDTSERIDDHPYYCPRCDHEFEDFGHVLGATPTP